MEMIKRVAENLRKLRIENPLVMNITNFVVTNLTANALLSIGASPVMVYEKKEVEEMVSISKVLVINIGTLTEDIVKSMFRAIEKANLLSVPVIFDPVGVGATAYRNKVAQEILSNFKIDAIRGNSSEVANLAGISIKTKGVDSASGIDNALDIAKTLAEKYTCTVCVSGTEDIITDSKNVYGINNGSIMLTKITGSGCMSTAIMGAFMAIDENKVSACVSGALVIGICGEIAAKQTTALGSFQVELFNCLSSFEDTYLESCKLEKIE